jgi:uncharacterized protein (DUF433 family)/DNA-binding transcriptional MerR regulator
MAAMVYSAQLAAALSGATDGQLRYWRQSRNGQPPLLAPEYGSRPASYSYRDVLTLRMFARLREEISLQKVRKAVACVESQLPKGAHISEEQIRALPGGKSAVWISKEGDYVDTVAQPGQSGIRVVIEDIFRSFRTFRGLEVPDLVHPEPGLLIDPAVKGGTPVAEGTRVTYDRLSGLRRDGLSVAEVRELYPWVSAESIEGATKFAHRLEEPARVA